MRTRQAMLVEPGRFEIEEHDLTPGPGEILVKMVSCGLCNWELGHWTGVLGELPMTLGHEGCGVVAELGEGVTGFAVGDAVTGLPYMLHDFADYYLLQPSGTINVSASREPGLMLGEPLNCVQNVVRAAHPQAGDIVAMIGCGPMGQWCIQYLSGNLIGMLVAVDIDPKKLEMAQGFGATLTINPVEGNAVEALSTLTGGHLADVVIEGTGSAKGIQQAIDLITPRGRLIVMSSFKHSENLDIVACSTKAISITFAYPDIFPDTVNSLRRLGFAINNNVFQVSPLISHIFTLENIQEAFQTLEHKPAGYLKGIVVP